MATIEAVGATTREQFAAELRKMETPTLIAQQCTQQGAIHAIAWLLRTGCTPARAADMLASLRTNMQLVRMEAHRRGAADLFPEDQTGFS